MVLYGSSDSNWSAGIDTGKSTGACIFLLDCAACSWKVKLIGTALLSSQESEHVEASEATKGGPEPSCVALLHHLGFGDPRPTDIFVDDKGAITPTDVTARAPWVIRMTLFCFLSNTSLNSLFSNCL